MVVPILGWRIGTDTTSNSGAQIAAETEPVSMETRLAILEDEIGDLRREVEDKDKSVLKRFAEWAGLIALVLAIAGGGFTVFDRVVAEPRKGRAADLSRLQEIVGNLTKINAELIRMSQELPADQFAGIASTQNSVKLTLALRAEKIIEKHGQAIDSPTALVVANEFLSFQDLEKAQKLSNIAIRAADNDLIRAEAKRYFADATMLLGGDSNIAEARETFEAALSLARKASGFQGVAIIGSVYRDWITSEAFGGRCDQAIQVFEDMRSELAALDAIAVLEVSEGQVAQTIRMQKLCSSMQSSFFQG